jgi:uncharacterized protein YecE (DUF72 family)
MIRVGCCGFPRKQSLCYDALDAVEVQATFYKPPQPSTVQRWRAQAPAGFAFTLKAWQLITHEPSSPSYHRSGVEVRPEARSRYGSFRPTAEVRAAWERTRQVAQALQAGFIVFQCPASFRPSEENIDHLRRFFAEIERPAARLAWEPRGEWPPGQVAELCADLNLIHCVDPFLQPPVTSGAAYFRLHGREGYHYRYTDAELQQLADRASGFAEAWVLFNNTAMWDDALRFRSRVDHIPSSS